jgi:hypothetical protein
MAIITELAMRTRSLVQLQKVEWNKLEANLEITD